MDGLQWNKPIEMDDLGVPLFQETSMCESMFVLFLGGVETCMRDKNARIMAP